MFITALFTDTAGSGIFARVVERVLTLFLCALLTGSLLVVGKYAHIACERLKQKTESEALKYFLDKIDLIIQQCVEATNQTFVNDIKNNGKLTDEQKKEAFEKTVDAVNQMISDADKEKIVQEFGDFSTYVTNNIEAYIGQKKDI